MSNEKILNPEIVESDSLLNLDEMLKDLQNVDLPALPKQGYDKSTVKRLEVEKENLKAGILHLKEKKDGGPSRKEVEEMHSAFVDDLEKLLDGTTEEEISKNTINVESNEVR